MPELIDRFGAVSTEVAEALAIGAVSRFGTGVGIGITGIAGPGGGTEEKPVGTVCFSVCIRDGSRLTRRLLSAREPIGYPRPVDHGRHAFCFSGSCEGC